MVSLGRLKYKGPEFETCSSVKFKYVLKYVYVVDMCTIRRSGKHTAPEMFFFFFFFFFFF